MFLPQLHFKMQAQTKISNFFTSPAPKRSSDIAGFDSISQENKIPKNHYQNEDTNSKSRQSSLSPEQKKRMEEKRLEAQAKLESKKGPQNFGLTWKKALAAEFDKEYFVKVSNSTDIDWGCACVFSLYYHVIKAIFKSVAGPEHKTV